MLTVRPPAPGRGRAAARAAEASKAAARSEGDNAVTSVSAAETGPALERKWVVQVKRIGARAGAMLAALAVAACASSSTKVMPPVINVSIGQQLIDLKKARESGAITQREYEQQARRVVDGVE